jgi:hypothetical protein
MDARYICPDCGEATIITWNGGDCIRKVARCLECGELMGAIFPGGYAFYEPTNPPGTVYATEQDPPVKVSVD